MKRARRLEPVREIAHEAERDCARRVAGTERRLAEAEQRCAELRRYHGEYQHSMQQRASVGLEVRSLREFQVFLARLASAIEAQQGLVVQLQAECERERGQLRGAMTRHQALSKVIERVRSDERRQEDRRTQRETDEHAQTRRQV